MQWTEMSQEKLLIWDYCLLVLGPVTDYGSSMVQWMRNRQPRHKGGVRMEMERPSLSYVLDVWDSIETGGSHIASISNG